jgi:hypothetical protein
MSEPLLRIRNHHSPSCGDPPIVGSDDPEVYIGYFENQYGEQWIFLYHRGTGKAELRGGDVNWNTVHEVKGGVVQGLLLNAEERAWLQACFRAAVPSSSPGA